MSKENDRCPTTFELGVLAGAKHDQMLRQIWHGCRSPLPLTISVSGYGPASGPRWRHNLTGEDAVDVLLSCSPRWKHGTFSCYLPRVAYLNASDVPLLQSIKFRSPSFGCWEHSTLLSGATALTKLYFEGRTEHVSKYSVNWANLTHLTIEAVGFWGLYDAVEIVSHILRQTLSLVSCDLRMDDDEPPRFVIEEISLPFLKILKISQLTMLQYVGIVRWINAPVLETFAYSYRSSDRIANARPLLDLLKRSPTLHELQLGYKPTSAEITEYLHYCPLLTIFDVQGVTQDADFSDEGFVESFVMEDQVNCLCPRLEYFRCGSSLKISGETLRKFVMRKNGTISSLKKWKGVVMTVGSDTVEQNIIEKSRSEEVYGHVGSS